MGGVSEGTLQSWHSYKSPWQNFNEPCLGKKRLWWYYLGYKRPSWHCPDYQRLWLNCLDYQRPLLRLTLCFDKITLGYHLTLVSQAASNHHGDVSSCWAEQKRLHILLPSNPAQNMKNMSQVSVKLADVLWRLHHAQQATVNYHNNKRQSVIGGILMEMSYQDVYIQTVTQRHGSTLLMVDKSLSN